MYRQAIDQRDGVTKTAQHTRSSFELSERQASYQPPIGVEVLCCAYAADGDIFAVGASDGVVRVYADDANKVPVLRVQICVKGLVA